MLLPRSFWVLGLSLLVTTTATAAPTRRPQRHNGIEGRVVQIHHDRKHYNIGWIKIRHGTARYYGRRRGTSALAAATRRGGQVRTIPVNASTRFERLGQRGRGVARLGFGSVHRGERVRVYLGSQKFARLVAVLPNAARPRHRYAHHHRYGSRPVRRYVYHRHPLVRNRVLVRNGRQPVRLNRPVVVKRPVVVRAAPHPLVRHRVVVARTVNHPHAKPKAPPKHTVVHKPAPPKHPAAHKPAPHPAHTTSHPHTSSHRKK